MKTRELLFNMNKKLVATMAINNWGESDKTKL